MKNWCKIIQLKDHDVLIQRLSTHEDGEHLSISLILDGVLCNYKAGYEENEKLADETFEKFNENDAERMLNNTLDMLK